MEVLKNYTAHVDELKRVTIQGASYQYYDVKEFDNDCVFLISKNLDIPEDALQQIDKSMRNLDFGNVSPEIDLTDF